MSTRIKINLWRFGQILLLCIVSVPHLAGAAALQGHVPTGPLDAYNGIPDYYTTANWANSPPLAKFVDKLPGLGSAKANGLGQYLSVGKPDITTYPGSDYYEIELREFQQRLHSDLPAPGTLQRGYVQVNRGTNLKPGTMPSENKCGADGHPCTDADTAPGTGITPDPIRALGPTLISERDRPVRIKFTNRLPAGAAGDLFIPVDTSVMGAGTGPANTVASRGDVATPCNNTVEPNSCASYTQNRATIHMHGGRTPWISDGTPHQWITPLEEITPFTKGVSVQNVPDMPDPGDGSMTFYFTNQQSARLMFYHDHSFGITRLNVYAGEVAGYLITDKYEQDLINRHVIPPDQIPLILQDKTFVDATPVPHPVSGVTTPRIRVTDPLWNWGSGTLNNGVREPVTGDLWLPHVYMPAQTSTAGIGGVNPFGRWMYGPWFYPATDVTKGPVDNPYYDPNCSSSSVFELAQCQTPGQPEKIPGTPNVSMGMEAFQDSAVVNGTVFPTLTVDPRAYRFRILNGASDRFWNLSFYKADPAQISPDTRPASRLTEVKMLPASAQLAAQNNWPADWPVDGRDGGVPDPALRGPSFLQIGTEGGFLPKPVLIKPQPITYNTDPTAFWVGNVDKMGLALGPAERADVIVDFSPYAGKTLILYNDAPAAWPARVAGYDYYTDAPDLRDSGGYGTGGVFNKITGVWEGGTGPLVGYAPNTRTVMQVIVRSTAGTDPTYNFSKAALEAEFRSPAPVTSLNPTGKSLFERAQEPIIVGQAAYQDVYPNSYFPVNFPWEGINQINDQFLKFVTLAGEQVNAPTHPKGIHDEMGASFDPVYGRMSGNLAMQLPNPTTLNALLILYGFSDLPTETIDNSIQTNVTVLSSAVADPFLGPATTNLADGTQIWKISHNGVDTHPIHFHIFDVQLINRVGWDGQIRMPEPNELGWKDTVKISPLEDTIVAVRPRAPALPFGITNSKRPLNPAIPIDSPMGFNSVDWKTGQARSTPVTNILYDFGWEYVWHCHILSHEEMDMMRPIVLNVVTTAPQAFTSPPSVATVNGSTSLTWVDKTPLDYNSLVTYTNPADALVAPFGDPTNEVGFRVYGSTDGAAYTPLNDGKIVPANSTSYLLTSTELSAGYTNYAVEAFNAAGSTYTYTNATTAQPLTVSVALDAASTSAAPATVILNATVSAASGVAVSKVEFYNGTTLIGASASTASPYSYRWNSVMGGSYSITAKATDNFGRVVVSSVLPVSVTGTLTADFTFTETPVSTGSANVCPLTFASNSTGTTAGSGYSWLINGTSYSTSAATLPISLPSGDNYVTLTVSRAVPVIPGTTETATITKIVTVVNQNPVAAINSPATITVQPQNSLTLSGSGTDADACDILTYAWYVDNKGAPYATTATPNLTISYDILKATMGFGTHSITLKVMDPHGGTGTAGPITVEVQSLRDGLYTGTTTPLASAFKVLLASQGLINPTAADIEHCDVSPYSNGKPVGDGTLDVNDAYIILMHAVGLANL
ncbi:MAG: multicopper oxidase domain-containing protein [Desulfuromonadaceae bacterium]